jgi:hypothetical protein
LKDELKVFNETAKKQMEELQVRADAPTAAPAVSPQRRDSGKSFFLFFPFRVCFA